MTLSFRVEKGKPLQQSPSALAAVVPGEGAASFPPPQAAARADVIALMVFASVWVHDVAARTAVDAATRATHFSSCRGTIR
jgi:hypothetical protein